MESRIRLSAPFAVYISNILYESKSDFLYLSWSSQLGQGPDLACCLPAVCLTGRRMERVEIYGEYG